MSDESDKIIIELTGLGLSAEEREQLHQHLRSQLVAFLQQAAKPALGPIVALGPGWIGMRDE
jgi:hypothetical protein